MIVHLDNVVGNHLDVGVRLDASLRGLADAELKAGKRCGLLQVAALLPGVGESKGHPVARVVSRGLRRRRRRRYDRFVGIIVLHGTRPAIGALVIGALVAGAFALRADRLGGEQDGVCRIALGGIVGRSLLPRSLRRGSFLAHLRGRNLLERLCHRARLAAEHHEARRQKAGRKAQAAREPAPRGGGLEDRKAAAAALRLPLAARRRRLQHELLVYMSHCPEQLHGVVAAAPTGPLTLIGLLGHACTVCHSTTPSRLRMCLRSSRMRESVIFTLLGVTA